MDEKPKASKSKGAPPTESPGQAAVRTSEGVVMENATTGHRATVRSRPSRKLHKPLRQSAESTSSVQSALDILHSNVQAGLSQPSAPSPEEQGSLELQG